MSIRFVAARPNAVPRSNRATTPRAPRGAANDNEQVLVAGSDNLLRAALRHFAEHGLSAAEQARKNAEEAFFAGRSHDYRRWLAICTALDRRMAAAVAFRKGASPKR